MNSTLACPAGDASWVLSSSVLVAAMVVGLGFLQAGAVRNDKVPDAAVLFVLGSALLCTIWMLIGFTLAFGPDLGGVIGSFAHGAFVGLDSVCLPKGSHVPGFTFALFEMMFAVISPLLVVGCIAREDVPLARLLVFLVAWQVLVYVPVTHSVWGGGWLQQLGALDFAGGIVVHTSSGAGALAVLLVRHLVRKAPARPGSTYESDGRGSAVLTTVGWALVALGWVGFNSGSAFSSGTAAGAAAVNTMLGSVIGTLAFGIVDRVFGKDATADMQVLLDGSLTGMASVTPLSGFAQPWACVLVAGVASAVTRVIMDSFGSRAARYDDMHVMFIHGLTGVLGSWSVSLFASLSINPEGADGLLFGNARLLWVQLVAVAVVLLWSLLMTAVLALLLLWWRCEKSSITEDERETSSRDLLLELGVHKPSEHTRLI